MRIHRIIFIYLLFTSLSGFSQENKDFVSGYVYDYESKKVLPNINISVAGTGFGGTTNQLGYFKFQLGKLPAVLFFSHVGYKIDSYTATLTDHQNIKVYLEPVTQEIDEVIITDERVQNLIEGDTLNIVDYEIWKNKIIMVANPYKNARKQRLYLANLLGDTLSSIKIEDGGKQIKFPEEYSTKTYHLFKDCFGNIHFLTSNRVSQIYINNDLINLLYPTSYNDFLSFLLPMKASMENKLIYQTSTPTYNQTLLIEKGKSDPISLITVKDIDGLVRYVPDPEFPDRPKKLVSAPVICKDNSIYIFDFFDDYIDVFNISGEQINEIHIDFHLREIKQWILKPYFDIDQHNFKQKILYDEVTNRAFALFRYKKNGRYSLKEIDLETGNVKKVIEIPDYTWIEKIQVNNNVVYFMYAEKKFPYNNSLFRMKI